MKAIVYSSDGTPEVLKLAEIDQPIPADDEVLIKVRAASVNPADWRVASAAPWLRSFLFAIGKDKVKRPGIDVAGQVEALGRNVTQFKIGDEVFGAAKGAYAEFTCAPEGRLALKPPNVTFEQAASIPIAGITALQALRDKGHIQPGHTVLINGAAGGVGTFAVQIAKSLGGRVTGVCSTRNKEMVRSLGAERVIDYTQEDFTKEPHRYDVIVDNVGNHSLSACMRLLTPNGNYVIAGGPKNMWGILSRSLKALLWSRFVSRRMSMFIARINSADLATLADLMKAGTVVAMIDRQYPLADVGEAFRYSEQGHARGKVVINLGS